MSTDDQPSPATGVEQAREGGDGHHAFWADEVADRVEARNPDDPVVVKGGVSPSGVPHVGHFNEILRGYYVAEVLRERGHEVRQVFTADDRDPLRKLPRVLADADWNLVGLDDVDAGALGRNLGKPYTDVPDPFGESDSYGDHFTDLLRRAADLVDVPVDVVSNAELYESGEFEAVTRHLLEHREQAREVLAAYQDSVDEDYVPFWPVCANCGVLTTTVTEVDLDADRVHYECTGIEAGNRTIEGCGNTGAATLREGKLPWRFEWPAQWSVLDVDFEPFGKDHAEGSWPSGTEIAERVLGDEPPEPLVYEWFTVGGEPLSSSAGTLVTVPEILDLVEPAVLRYFFALDPNRGRDLDLERVDLLVDDFDRFEELYYGEARDERAHFAGRAYPFVVRDATALAVDLESGVAPGGERFEHGGVESAYALRERYLQEVHADRVRLPYTFAAVLGMTDDDALRERMARNENHLADDTPAWAVREALARVPRAREWARRYDNAYNYRLQATCPDADFDPETRAALDELADFVAAGHDGDAIQGEIYELADRHDVPVGEFFAAGYRLFFDAEQGPRLGEFLGELDREFVVARLRRER